MIPTTTGAAKATSLVIPEVEGKMDGMAIRVPTADVSLVDLTVEVEKDTDAEGVKDAFRNAAAKIWRVQPVYLLLRRRGLCPGHRKFESGVERAGRVSR